MSAHHADVPFELRRAAVLRSAEARRAGHTDWAIRRMTKPGGITGARCLNGRPLSDDPYGRVLAAAVTASPRAVIAGWSAAVLLGVPGDFINGSWGDNDVRPVCVHPRVKTAQRAGVHYTFSKLDDDDVLHLEFGDVTSGVRTAFDCLRFGRGRADALAQGDACLRFGLTTRDELLAYADERRRWPGIRRVRELAPLLSPFAESPMESWMRLVWLDAGLPAPLVNAGLYAPDGTHLARVDLLDPVTGLVGEYDGLWHELGRQPLLDAEREDLVRIGRFEFVRGCSKDVVDGGIDLGARLKACWRERTHRNLRPSPLIRVCPQE